MYSTVHHRPEKKRANNRALKRLLSDIDSLEQVKQLQFLCRNTSCIDFDTIFFLLLLLAAVVCCLFSNSEKKQSTQNSNESSICLENRVASNRFGYFFFLQQ
jgi:hypothetical protein